MSKLTKLHPANLDTLAAVVDAYGQAYLHGDGNIYEDEKNSNHHQDFSNENAPEATYRCHYRRGDVLPQTIDQAEKDMINYKAKDAEKKAAPTAQSQLTKTIKIPAKPTAQVELKDLK